MKRAAQGIFGRDRIRILKPLVPTAPTESPLARGDDASSHDTPVPTGLGSAYESLKCPGDGPAPALQGPPYESLTVSVCYLPRLNIAGAGRTHSLTLPSTNRGGHHSPSLRPQSGTRGCEHP